MSTGGRIVLVNSVLGSLPIYYMSSILLPRNVRELLDAKRRAFLWTGEEHCHGSSCLVAWDDVCQPRELGGLGVKSLEEMNHGLLLKFVHKLHDPEPLPWKQWFISHSDLGRGLSSDSYLGKLISSEVQRYQHLTRVRVGDGAHTSFWHDRWLFNAPLQEAFPVLYSHVLLRDLTVRATLDTGFQTHLRPRLTNAASSEAAILLSCLEQVQLAGYPDSRFLHSSDQEPFSSRGAYRSMHGEALPSDATLLWTTRLPTKIKFFAWLLSRGRLNTRSYLHHRNIRSLDESWCAHCPGVLEMDAHIFSGCHRARGVWARLGISVPDAIVRRPWDIGVNVPLPDAVRLDIVLLILWHLWKCRNAVVFDQNDSGSLDVLTRVDRDMDAWMSRYRKVSPSVQQWKAWLNHCASASPM